MTGFFASVVAGPQGVHENALVLCGGEEKLPGSVLTRSKADVVQAARVREGRYQRHVLHSRC